MKHPAGSLQSRILEGAVALFIEKGIDKVTTRELTEALGLSRSHIYHYFRDWQSLCLAALNRFMLANLAELQAQIAPLSPEQQLLWVVEDYLPDQPDAIWHLYASFWQQAAHNAAYAELAQDLTLRWEALLTGVIENGVAQQVFRPVDAQRVTRQLSAMLNGYADQRVVLPGHDSSINAREDVKAFITLALMPSLRQ